MGLGKLSACALVCALMLGCGKTMEDLHQYVEGVKARESTGIPPIPEVKPYEPFAYQGNNRMDPFDSSVIAKAVSKPGPSGEGTLSPDPDRPPEFLESFPLDTLRMVGTLAQGPVLWALVRTPDSTIQRVKKGNYMGQNYGKINRISDSGIDLTEVVQDGISEHWIERNTYVALSDKKS
jgi:type IV pilus assembly protein PilP